MRPSRRMISGEVAVALFALAYAWSGGIAWPLEPGPLFKLIHAKEGWIGSLTWALLLGLPALMSIIAGGREIFLWTTWTQGQLEDSASCRGRWVCAQGVSWLYMLHLVWKVDGGDKLPVLLAHAVIGVFFCFWSYLENRRVRREIRCSGTRASFSAG